jgi:hypothetical protein
VKIITLSENDKLSMDVETWQYEDHCGFQELRSRAGCLKPPHKPEE